MSGQHTSAPHSTVSTSAPVITVDGPAASGKGTIAAGVAQALGYHQLDSGSLYRLVALAALEAGVAADDDANLAAIADELDVTFANGRIVLEGRDFLGLITRIDVLNYLRRKLS